MRVPEMGAARRAQSACPPNDVSVCLVVGDTGTNACITGDADVDFGATVVKSQVEVRG